MKIYIFRTLTKDIINPLMPKASILKPLYVRRPHQDEPHIQLSAMLFEDYYGLKKQLQERFKKIRWADFNSEENRITGNLRKAKRINGYLFILPGKMEPATPDDLRYPM